jgi:hypothetical protein
MVAPMDSSTSGLDVCDSHNSAPLTSVHRCGPMLPANWSGDRCPVCVMMPWLGHAVHGKKIKDRKCQDGRDGGVHTHHDFGGAERQSNFYVRAVIGTRQVIRSILCTCRLTGKRCHSSFVLVADDSRGWLLLARPRLEICWALNMVLHQSVEQCTSGNGRKRLVD